MFLKLEAICKLDSVLEEKYETSEEENEEEEEEGDALADEETTDPV